MLYWRDILERSLWTFAQAFLAAFPTAEAFTDFGIWQSAGTSAVAATGAFLLSVIKNIVKQRYESY